MRDSQHLPKTTVTLAFDATDVMARVDGDRELLAELVDIVRTESPLVLSEISRCLDGGDPHGVERAAHRLRGSVSVFGAHAVSQAALELELMARGRDLTTAAPKLDELQREVERLTSDLAAFSEDCSL